MRAPDPWDALSPYFDTSRAEVASGAADNILIAWPVLLRFIAEHAPAGAVRVLDYGCGGGGFAQKLQSLGFRVVGVDSSPAMIDTARTAHPELEFEVADAGSVGMIQFGDDRKQRSDS
jgi:SAM-dependent methyltransferase